MNEIIAGQGGGVTFPPNGQDYEFIINGTDGDSIGGISGAGTMTFSSSTLQFELTLWQKFLKWLFPRQFKFDIINFTLMDSSAGNGTL